MIQHDELCLCIDLFASLDFLRHFHQHRSHKACFPHCLKHIVAGRFVVFPTQTVCGNDHFRIGDLFAAKQRENVVLLRSLLRLFCLRRNALHLCHFFLADHDVGFCRIDDDTADIDTLLQQDPAVLVKCNYHCVRVRIVLPLQEFQPVGESRKELYTVLVGNSHERSLHVTLTILVRFYLVQLVLQRDRSNKRCCCNCVQHFFFGLYALLFFEFRHCGNQIRVFDCGFFQL